MPKTTKKKAVAIDPNQPFEQALERLEDLVGKMESDQLPLDQLINNYEEGTALYRVCEKRLDEAQGRIELIRKKRSGAVELEPFDKSDAANEETLPNVNSEEGSDAESDDGELF